MVSVKSKALKDKIKVDRIIGEYTQGLEGPVLVVTAGVHGNEPSGIFGLKRVFKRLEKDQPKINGALIGVTGNMAALDRRVRYIDYDLNRICKFETIEELRQSEIYNSSEGKELEEIMQYFDKIKNTYSERYFIDCHTTSSESQPYISAHDFPHSVEFASKFPVYTVTGLGKSIPGTMDDYLNLHGFTGFTFESGQHDDLASIENHEAVIWLTLANTGMLERDDIGCYPQCDAILKKTVVEGKKIFQTIYRYPIGDGEDFKMKPGYVNFQKIEKGEVLAQNEERAVCSDWNARILMPLYQKQGSDGFFVVEEVAEEQV